MRATNKQTNKPAQMNENSFKTPSVIKRAPPPEVFGISVWLNI